jgi:hypothetical protein
VLSLRVAQRPFFEINQQHVFHEMFPLPLLNRTARS